MIHRRQKEEHQDDVSPAEKGRETSLEQCQSLGPSLNEAYWLLTKWQGKDAGKVILCAKSPVLLIHEGVSCSPSQQQPARQSGAITCITSSTPANAQYFYAKLTGKLLQWQPMRKVHMFILLGL